MHAEIYIDGKWHPCEFEHPHRPDLANVYLPLGIRSRQPGLSAQYNARVVMPLRGPVIPPGAYLVRQEQQHFHVEIHDVKHLHLFGNATRISVDAAAVPD